MVKYEDPVLDRVFSALADSTRRGVLDSLALKRHYPVAPEKVWRAWTDPQALKRWFGPGGPQAVSVADRDSVMGKVTKDKRLAAMMNSKALPFDGKRMFYGGFKVMVDL